MAPHICSNRLPLAWGHFTGCLCWLWSHGVLSTNSLAVSVVQIDEQSSVMLRRSKVVWQCLWCVWNYFKFTFIHILRNSAEKYVLFSSMRRSNELQFVQESNRDCQRHRILQAWIWNEICSDTKNQRLKDTIHKVLTPNDHVSIRIADRKIHRKVQIRNHKRHGCLHRSSIVSM